ncbi:16125_t:CDS:2 [Entrophospora sp. SA101]|nr:16125_t:CDS:2 [Entrophospora sp. SA101]
MLNLHPGDFICVDPTLKDRTYINVPKGHIWIQGDNMNNSIDSRSYGPVPHALIRGRVFARSVTVDEFVVVIMAGDVVVVELKIEKLIVDVAVVLAGTIVAVVALVVVVDYEVVVVAFEIVTVVEMMAFVIV